MSQLTLTAGNSSLAPMDLEQQKSEENAPLIKGGTAPRNKLNIGLWACLGTSLIVLIILAATTGRSGPHPLLPQPQQSPLPLGAVSACSDDDALCNIYNVIPIPERDYRNRSRIATSKYGMVSADQSRCSDIGAALLAGGGNAIDAAVAVALCQGVVNPFASGPGGGNFMLIRLANGSAVFINARETAPANASTHMYDGKDPYASLDGGLSIAVPLELRGLELAWKRYGKLPWSKLVTPAARIARHGFAAHPYFVYIASGPHNLQRMRADPLMRETFMKPDPDGAEKWRLPRIGEFCCQRPVLAATLDAIAANGVEWLYTPERRQTMAAEIQAAGGIVTAEDFDRAVPRVEAPLTDSAAGFDLIYPAPPSSGVIVGLVLKLLSGFNNTWQGAGLLGTHRLVESMKHGFVVRMALGDPGTSASPYFNISAVVADLFNASFVDSLRASINDTAVLRQDQYGGKWNPVHEARMPDDHGTSHMCTMDSEGNAVSMTSTVNTVFGSNVMSASTGLVFNNEMDDFSKPGLANGYGLEPSVANYIQPGKRPLSSMSPMMLLKDGKLRMVVGASGGPYIITSIIQTVIRQILLGQDPFSAVYGGRVHSQWMPNVTRYEQYRFGNVPFTVDNSTVSYLAAEGNSMSAAIDQLGCCQGIVVDPSTGLMTGWSDPRKDGAPAGVDRM